MGFLCIHDNFDIAPREKSLMEIVQVTEVAKQEDLLYLSNGLRKCHPETVPRAIHNKSFPCLIKNKIFKNYSKIHKT